MSDVTVPVPPTKSRSRSYSFHAWSCGNCDLIHETFGSRMDASEYARECSVTEHEACTSCIKPCAQCAAAVCDEHLVDIAGDRFCPNCAIATADEWQDGAEAAIQDAILLRDRAEKALAVAV